MKQTTLKEANRYTLVVESCTNNYRSNSSIKEVQSARTMGIVWWILSQLENGLVREVTYKLARN